MVCVLHGVFDVLDGKGLFPHRKLCILVSSSDRSYVPKLIDVEGGSSSGVLRVLKTVIVPGGTHGTVTLLKKQDWHYKHIFIRIKECQHVRGRAMMVGCVCVGVSMRVCVCANAGTRMRCVCVYLCVCMCACVQGHQKGSGKYT